MSRDIEQNAFVAHHAEIVAKILTVITIVLFLLATNNILEWSWVFKSALLTAAAIIIRYGL
ncbi:hypothetical protein SOASR032_02060 [Pragia fontium]|uniref:Uncharacterized protein n=1 Tax=Pragia fontium TaxID=82985 RepID=A0ABQ5LDE2_9GAMM|nr:hypothetical protein [Pragia fontium]GKX61637.1 hypothetical protein SOASR032_02060 [Pragia fontium]